MKKLSFTLIAKIFAIIYFLFLLSLIAYNSGNGRYQLRSGSVLIIDTKTGKLYQYVNGNLELIQ